MNPLLQALVDGPQPSGAAGYPIQSPAPVPNHSPLAVPAKPPIQKLRYEHRAMAKMIAAKPTISQNELAAIFEYSPSWISTIIASDAFQAILFEEMEKSDFPAAARVQAKLQIEGILSRSMEILRAKLDKPADQVPDQLAIQTFKSAATSLGMGVRDVKINVNETHNHLNELGENLVGLLRRRKAEAIDGEILPHPEPTNG